MGAFKFLGMAAMVYTTILLAVSFFVLFVNTKVVGRGLKIYGYIVATLLGLAAIAVLSSGIYISLRGHQPMMQDMMRGQAQQMPMKH